MSAHDERAFAARAEAVDGEVIVEGGHTVQTGAEPLGYGEVDAVGDGQALVGELLAAQDCRLRLTRDGSLNGSRTVGCHLVAFASPPRSRVLGASYPVSHYSTKQ